MLGPVIVIAVVLLGNALYLVHYTDPNPLGPRSALALSVVEGPLPGERTIDPNNGFITQAIGRQAAHQIGNGDVPLWNPYEGAGSPLLASGQSAALFPPTMLNLLSNGLFYETLLLELVAGLSTYFLMRRLRVHEFAAVAAGAAFALNGTFAVAPERSDAAGGVPAADPPRRRKGPRPFNGRGGIARRLDDDRRRGRARGVCRLRRDRLHLRTPRGRLGNLPAGGAGANATPPVCDQGRDGRRRGSVAGGAAPDPIRRLSRGSRRRGARRGLQHVDPPECRAPRRSWGCRTRSDPSSPSTIRRTSSPRCGATSADSYRPLWSCSRSSGCSDDANEACAWC